MYAKAQHNDVAANREKAELVAPTSRDITISHLLLLLSLLPTGQYQSTQVKMAAVDFVTGYITNYVDGMVRPYVEQGCAAVGDVAGGAMFSVSTYFF